MGILKEVIVPVVEKHLGCIQQFCDYSKTILNVSEIKILLSNHGKRDLIFVK